MSTFIQQLGLLWERVSIKVTQQTQRMLQILLIPVLLWCKKVGLTPLMFTITRIVALPLLYLLLQEGAGGLFWAGILLIFLIITDFIDGTLARYLGIENDRSTFEDLFGDHLMYSVSLLGIMTLRGAGIELVAYNLVIMPVATLLAVLKKHEKGSTDWVINPRPGLGYYKVLFYFFFFAYIFFAKNYLDQVFWLMNVLLTLESIYYFWALQKKWAEK